MLWIEKWNMPQIVEKNKGVNRTEQYLGVLCEKSFLSLWSYPGLFRKPTKELCDLTVVFGRDIIIFSDKNCAFPNSGDIKEDWDVWFKRAIAESANQAWGAERWIKNFPQRIFLDSQCKKVFPYGLPDMKTANFHIVLVAHQISKACKDFHGGSGSLMITNDSGLISAMPFVIGDLDKSKTFVHVLDDTSLDLVMKNVDTIADFVGYLSKKEKFFRSSIKIMSSGEEDLLAYYLKNIDEQEEHDFILPDEKTDSVFFDESIWEGFEANPQRIAQKKADEISYFWDSLIESFSRHALSGTQYFKQESNFELSEKILRFLAKTSRFERRILSKSFIEILEKTPKHLRMIRCIPPIKKDDPYYVFLLFPWKDDKPENSNRTVRAAYLEACCKVVKHCFPDAIDIVGLATESGRGASGSEDAAYLDARLWTKEMDDEAKKLQKDLGIFVNPDYQFVHDEEYPESEGKEDDFQILNNPRNKPCPCGATKPTGSPVKYKHCCGSK